MAESQSSSFIRPTQSNANSLGIYLLIERAEQYREDYLVAPDNDHKSHTWDGIANNSPIEIAKVCIYGFTTATSLVSFASVFASSASVAVTALQLQQVPVPVNYPGLLYLPPSSHQPRSTYITDSQEFMVPETCWNTATTTSFVSGAFRVLLFRNDFLLFRCDATA